MLNHPEKSQRIIIFVLIFLCLGLWTAVFWLRMERLSQKIPFASGHLSFIALQLDVGQGDSLLIITPDRQTILVDCGPGQDGKTFLQETLADKIAPILELFGIKQIDRIILTHHDYDHMGGIFSLLGRIPVAEVYDNGRVHPSEAYDRFIQELRHLKIPLKNLKKGDILKCGEYSQAQVLGPEYQKGFDDNDGSVILRMTYGNFEMLLTGDISFKAERELCLDYGRGLKCDFLKVPHHGSKTSSSFDFLKFTKPVFVGFSCGLRNDYGHPASMILERYRKLCRSSIFRTDEEGSILMISDGEECIAVPEKGNKTRFKI
jgi:competence protein ComEC